MHTFRVNSHPILCGSSNSRLARIRPIRTRPRFSAIGPAEFYSRLHEKPWSIDVGSPMLVVLLSLLWASRTVMIQLSGFCCDPKPKPRKGQRVQLGYQLACSSCSGSSSRSVATTSAPADGSLPTLLFPKSGKLIHNIRACI